MTSPPAGGPATVNGVLYQILWSLLRALKMQNKAVTGFYNIKTLPYGTPPTALLNLLLVDPRNFANGVLREPQ